jgi:hypothetical protein
MAWFVGAPDIVGDEFVRRASEVIEQVQAAFDAQGADHE